MPEKMEIKLAHDVRGIGRAGQVVELALTPSDTHVPEEVGVYVGGYQNGEYRADEVSPVILEDKETGFHRTFSSNNVFKRTAVKGDAGRTNEIDPDSDLDTYKVIPRKIGSFIDDRLVGNASSYNAMMQGGRLCKNAISLDRDYEVFRNVLGESTNWDASVRTAISGDDIWNGGSTSNPIRDVQAAIEKSAQSVTGIWFNQKVAHTFLRHDEVKSHMRQMLGDSAVKNTVASVANAMMENVDFQIPGLPPFHVTAAKMLNDSNEREFILADIVLLVHIPANVPDDGSDVSTSYTFRQRGPDGTGYYVRNYRVEDRGPLGGEMVVVTTMDDEKMTSTIAGGIITGIIG